MIQTKTLKPSLKERKRYIVFEVVSDKSITREALIKAVNDICLHCLGVFGMSKAGVIILKNQITPSAGIIRVCHTHVDEVKASLQFITHIEGIPVAVHARGVSGGINTVRRKFMTLEEQKLAKSQSMNSNPRYKKKMEKSNL